MSCFEIILAILTAFYAYLTYWIVKASVKTPFVVIDKIESFHDGDTLGGFKIYVSNLGDAVAVDLKVKVVMKELKSKPDEQGVVLANLDYFEAVGSNFLAEHKEGIFILNNKDYFMAGDKIETPAAIEYEDGVRWGLYLNIFNFIELPSEDLAPIIKLTKVWRGPFKKIRYKNYINNNKLLET